MFKRLFRTDSFHFNQWAELLETQKAHERAGKISKRGAPEVVGSKISLAMTLRTLAGGAYQDQCLIFNVKPSSFFDVVKRTLVPRAPV